MNNCRFPGQNKGRFPGRNNRRFGDGRRCGGSGRLFVYLFVCFALLCFVLFVVALLFFFLLVVFRRRSPPLVAAGGVVLHPFLGSENGLF